MTTDAVIPVLLWAAGALALPGYVKIVCKFAAHGYCLGVLEAQKTVHDRMCRKLEKIFQTQQPTT